MSLKNNTMKEWAMKYAALGFAVFPLKPHNKVPATSDGFKSATTAPQQINAWWDGNPLYNIGIATGAVSRGLLVLDLDEDDKNNKHGPEEARKWLVQRKTDFPKTATVRTGRGGIHMFYYGQGRNRSNLLPGVDVRGEGGYIVAPPSIHPNGNTYKWLCPFPPPIANANGTVYDFICQTDSFGGAGGFQLRLSIPTGQRTGTLIKLIGSLKAKGLSDEAIQAAVRAENEKCCSPPLSDRELEKQVFPAIYRGWREERPYRARYSSETGSFQRCRSNSLDMAVMDKVEEKQPEWLIPGYAPRYQITSLAGDGGSGKTTVWCAIAAAVSSGSGSFLEYDAPEDWAKGKPKKVMFFSAEDSYEYTLKRRLRKNGADLSNILSIDVADKRFQDVKFNSPYLERLLDYHRPALCIFDPIQAFVPPEIRMGDRNAMRSCLAPLIGYGEKYGTSFLIVEHANKQSGVWGRKRIADSADIWDISRSVLMLGNTNEAGVRYLTHEKSNYGPLEETILFAIEDERIVFKGHTTKRDKDFVVEESFNTRQKPQRDEAVNFILDFLKDGEKEVSELDEMAKVMNISKNSLKNAKADLKHDGKIKTWSIGYGESKKYFIRLLEALPYSQ